MRVLCGLWSGHLEQATAGEAYEAAWEKETVVPGNAATEGHGPGDNEGESGGEGVNTTILAHQIAARIPELARDSTENAANLIQGLMDAELKPGSPKWTLVSYKLAERGWFGASCVGHEIVGWKIETCDELQNTIVYLKQKNNAESCVITFWKELK